MAVHRSLRFSQNEHGAMPTSSTIYPKRPAYFRRMQAAFSLFIICACLIASASLHAASCLIYGSPEVINGPRSPQLANISPDLPIGTVFQTITGSVPQVAVANCGRGAVSTMGLDFSGSSRAQAVAGMSNVYTYPDAHWNGLGFRLKENGNPIALHQTHNITGSGTGTTYYYGPATWTVEYLKIGSNLPPNSGNPCNLTSNDVTVLIDGHSAGAVMRACANYQTLNPTCKATATNITIPLGTFNTSAFPAVGSASPRSANYNINLSCTDNPTVRMSVSGTTVSGYPSLFGLDAGSAGGIAVQLYNNGSQITPGQSYVISTYANTTLAVPISANYYRIGDVTPGSANAHMIATFSYN